LREVRTHQLDLDLVKSIINYQDLDFDSLQWKYFNKGKNIAK